MWHRNWLYIPKKDKWAIFILLSLIFLFSLANFLIKKIQQSNEIEVSETTIVDPKDIGMKYVYNKPLKPKVVNRKQDLNSIELSELYQTIKGIDTIFLPRIIAYRSILRGYASTDQLIEVTGLDMHTQSILASHLTVISPHDSIYINRESFSSLLRHPYLNYKQCLIITDIRQRKGNIKSIKRLRLLEEFSRHDLERLAPYLNFAPNTDME